MRFHERGLRLVCVVAGVLTLTTAAQAQYKQQNAGQVGNFAILKISEDGGRSVDRCAASMGPANNMLRIAFVARSRVHSLSIPGVPGSGNALMTITLDGRNVFTYQAAGANDQRAWVGLDYGVVDAIMAAKKSIAVNFAGRNFAWSLAGQNMEMVMQAVSNCVSGSYGAAPAAPPPAVAVQASPPPSAMPASPPPAGGQAAAPAGNAEKLGNGLFRIAYATAGGWEVVRFARDPGGRAVVSCAAFRLIGSEQGFHFGYSKAKAEFSYGFMGEGSAMRPNQPVVLWFNEERAGVSPVDATLIADPDGAEWLSITLSTDEPGAEDAFMNQKTVSVAYDVEGKPHTESFPLAGSNAALRKLFACGQGI